MPLYAPPYHRETDPAKLRALVEQYPLAFLVGVDSAGLPHINPIPLLYEAQPEGLGMLLGHVDKRNPLVEIAEAGRPITAVFHGPHGYVSPRWYAGERTAPTWNHLEVICHCTCAVLRNPEAIYTAVDRLTQRFEGDAWRVADRPAGFVAGLLKVLVAFQLTITSWEGHFKLSQDKPATDRAEVIRQLRQSGHSQLLDLAKWMESI